MPREFVFEDRFDRQEFEHEARALREVARRFKWPKRRLKAYLKWAYETNQAGKDSTWFDGTHGLVRLTPVEQELLQNPALRRLDRVRQNINYLTLYLMGMRQTRLHHSVGTMAVADRIARQVRLGERERQEVRLAGLLHDVGHFAFSHSAEPFVKAKLGVDHEEVAEQRLREAGVPEILQRHGLDFDRVLRFSRGEGLGELVSEYADRMDYLQRDMSQTGISHRTRRDLHVTLNRFLKSLALKDGKVCVRGEEGRAYAEKYARYRTLLFSELYLHPTSLLARDLLQRAIKRGLKEGSITAEHFVRSHDDEVLARLKGPEAEQLRLSPDSPYRPLFNASFADLNEKGRLAVRRPEFQKAVSRLLRRHLKPHEFALGATPPFEKDFRFRVLHEDGRVEEARARARAPDEHKFFYVAATRENPEAKRALRAIMKPYLRENGRDDRPFMHVVERSLYSWPSRERER
jgi:hypothetical protein